MFYIANVTQLAGIFGMIYVQTTSQSSPNHHKAQGCIHCRQTVNHHFTLWLQGPWKLLYFILPFFSPLLLTVYSIKWATISLLSGTPENNRKAKASANPPCFTAIFFIYIYQNVARACGTGGAGALQPVSLPGHWPHRPPCLWPAGPPSRAEKAAHSHLSALLWLMVV